MGASGAQDMKFSRRAKPGSGIGDAAFLIAAGNGIRDGADLERLRELAARMGGVLAVSRSLGVRPYAKDDPVLGGGPVVKPSEDFTVAIGRFRFDTFAANDRSNESRYIGSSDLLEIYHFNRRYGTNRLALNRFIADFAILDLQRRTD